MTENSNKIKKDELLKAMGEQALKIHKEYLKDQGMIKKPFGFYRIRPNKRRNMPTPFFRNRILRRMGQLYLQRKKNKLARKHKLKQRPRRIGKYLRRLTRHR